MMPGRVSLGFRLEAPFRVQWHPPSQLAPSQAPPLMHGPTCSGKLLLQLGDFAGNPKVADALGSRHGAQERRARCKVGQRWTELLTSRNATPRQEQEGFRPLIMQRGK